MPPLNLLQNQKKILRLFFRYIPISESLGAVKKDFTLKWNTLIYRYIIYLITRNIMKKNLVRNHTVFFKSISRQTRDNKLGATYVKSKHDIHGPEISFI